MTLSSNAFCVKFRDKDYFLRSGQLLGLDLIRSYPRIEGAYVLIDSFDMGMYGLVDNGRLVENIFDYMLDMDTKISIEEARKKHSMLFI